MSMQASTPIAANRRNQDISIMNDNNSNEISVELLELSPSPKQRPLNYDFEEFLIDNLELDVNEDRVEKLFTSHQLRYNRPEDTLATPVLFSEYKEQAIEAIRELDDRNIDFQPYSYAAIGSCNLVFADLTGHVLRFNYRHINMEEQLNSLALLKGVEGINYPKAYGLGWSYSKQLIPASFDVGIFNVRFIREYYQMGLKLLRELKARNLYYGDWFIDNLGLDFISFANNETKLRVIDIDFSNINNKHFESHHRHIAKVFNNITRYTDDETIAFAFDDACFRADVAAMIEAIRAEHEDTDAKRRYEMLVYNAAQPPLTHEQITEALAHLDEHVNDNRKSDYKFEVD